MSPFLPALAAGLAVAVAVGLPSPRRRSLLPQARVSLPGVTPVAGALTTGLALLLPLGPVGALVAALGAAMAVRAWRARQHGARRREERGRALEAMAALSAELRAGRPPEIALARAAEVASGPCAVGLREAAAATGLGDDAARALRRAGQGSAVPQLLDSLAVCWEVCQGAGSSLAAAVDRLEEALRAEQVTREEVEAELSGPRTSAQALAVMPVFGLLLGASIGGNPLDVLLHRPVGWGCLVVGVGLELAGLAWTSAIVRRAGGTP